MKKILTLLMLTFMVIGLSACRGELVEVPPAHVGKIMTKDGYREGVIGTSKFRLDVCYNYCDKLVLLPVADQANIETLASSISSATPWNTSRKSLTSEIDGL